MSTRYASFGTGIRRSPKTSVVQPWYRSAGARPVSTNPPAGLTTVSMPGTAHTKSAFTQLIASTTGRANLLSFRISAPFASGANSAALLDLAVGAAGSEVVIAANIAIGGMNQYEFTLPVQVPSGSRLSFRAQSVRTTGTVGVAVTFLETQDYGLTPGSVDVIGTSSATSAGTAMSGASGSWVEVIASTTKDYQSVIVLPSINTDTVVSTAFYLYTLGVGSAGNEAEIGTVGVYYTTAEQVIATVYLPCASDPVPAGSRLSVRHRLASNPERYTVCLIGIPYV